VTNVHKLAYLLPAQAHNDDFVNASRIAVVIKH